MKVDIIILNYNGKELLKEYLPGIVTASKESRYDCRVIVLDNKSTDESVNFLEQNFKEVSVYHAKKNRVFCSFNDAAKDSAADILILLNNDIKVEQDFIDPLIEVFKKHKNAFLVGSKCLLFDKVTYEGTKSKWWIEKGMFKSSSHYNGCKKYMDTAGYTMQAGFGAFDRNKFLELEGFDDLYLPGIIEDADICYRAWKRGYKGYYQPKSLIYHMGQASFKKVFGSKKIMELAHRNTFLFMWKNIDDPLILLKHIAWLPFRLIYSLITGKVEFMSGFLKSIIRLRQAVCRRAKRDKSLLTDMEVFNISDNI